MKTRDENLKDLMNTENIYDLLIIGGGSSGAGVALEGSSRGLKCAVIDSYDFASGTSSRSTKMAHGGLRYFEKMMKLEGDPFINYRLLKETLHERNYFLMCAPYQNKQLDLIIPTRNILEAAFMYYPACLMYHFIYLK
jgi:glycerol-3-phosphate dehydrogenase